MISDIQEQDNHQYLSDAQGHKTHIVLPLEEYQALLGIHPEDDEELTEETIIDLRFAAEESKTGAVVSAEEMQTKFNLSQQFPIKP